MGAFKQFLTSDIIVTPFEVNKGFYFEGEAALTASNVGIDRFIGRNITSSIFEPLTEPTTGQVSTQYQKLVYRSIKELYYGNYLTGSYGDSVATASILLGADPEGDTYIGDANTSGRFAEYFPTSLNYFKYFPTGSDNIIAVLSIPSRLFGNYVVPKSFTWSTPSGSIYDDGEGNLILSSSQDICGNIFYEHGIAVITSDSEPQADSYGSGIYGETLYGVSDVIFAEYFATSSNVTCSFSSSLTIYENQYKCTVRENEFNFSLNPSIISGSNGVPYNFVTSSYFQPYCTTIGLYNDSYELLAVAKLAQPLPISQTTDTTILINLDLL